MTLLVGPLQNFQHCARLGTYSSDSNEHRKLMGTGSHSQQNHRVLGPMQEQSLCKNGALAKSEPLQHQSLSNNRAYATSELMQQWSSCNNRDYGHWVCCRPLAGTRRRGKLLEEDKTLEASLLKDEKERCEHIMLVDLGRNDVGKAGPAALCTWHGV